MPYSTKKGTGKDKGKTCVYKKSSKKKVGCTDGPIEKYLTALHMAESKDFEWVDKIVDIHIGMCVEFPWLSEANNYEVIHIEGTDITLSSVDTENEQVWGIQMLRDKLRDGSMTLCQKGVNESNDMDWINDINPIPEIKIGTCFVDEMSGVLKGGKWIIKSIREKPSVTIIEVVNSKGKSVTLNKKYFEEDLINGRYKGCTESIKESDDFQWINDAGQNKILTINKLKEVFNKNNVDVDWDIEYDRTEDGHGDYNEYFGKFYYDRENPISHNESYFIELYEKENGQLFFYLYRYDEEDDKYYRDEVYSQIETSSKDPEKFWRTVGWLVLYQMGKIKPGNGEETFDVENTVNESDDLDWIKKQEPEKEFKKSKSYAVDVRHLRPDTPISMSPTSPKYTDLTREDILDKLKAIGYNVDEIPVHDVGYLYVEPSDDAGYWNEDGDWVKQHYWVDYDTSDKEDPTYGDKYQMVNIEELMFLIDNKIISESDDFDWVRDEPLTMNTCEAYGVLRVGDEIIIDEIDSWEENPNQWDDDDEGEIQTFQNVKAKVLALDKCSNIHRGNNSNLNTIVISIEEDGYYGFDEMWSNDFVGTLPSQCQKENCMFLICGKNEPKHQIQLSEKSLNESTDLKWIQDIEPSWLKIGQKFTNINNVRLSRRYEPKDKVQVGSMTFEIYDINDKHGEPHLRFTHNDVMDGRNWQRKKEDEISRNYGGTKFTQAKHNIDSGFWIPLTDCEFITTPTLVGKTKSDGSPYGHTYCKPNMSFGGNLNESNEFDWADEVPSDYYPPDLRSGLKFLEKWVGQAYQTDDEIGLSVQDVKENPSKDNIQDLIDVLKHWKPYVEGDEIYWAVEDLISSINPFRFQELNNVGLFESHEFDWVKGTGLGKVDLRDCKPGDILVTRSGKTAEYVGPSEGHYDHEIKFEKNSYGTRTHDGYVFRKNRRDDDEDIIKVLGENKKSIKEVAGISFESRKWGEIIYNEIMDNPNEKKRLIIDGYDHPEAFDGFPIDYVIIDFYDRLTGYGQEHSGYDKDGNYVVLLYIQPKLVQGQGGYDLRSVLNHEMKHAWDDYNRLSKGLPSIDNNKESKELYNKDFILMLSDQNVRGPIKELLKYYYYLSKLETTAYLENVYDENPVYEKVVRGIAGEDFESFKDRFDLDINWHLMNTAYNIPLLKKFKSPKEFIDYSSSELRSRAIKTIKKINKMKYVHSKL